jgi:hypothetical protein
MFGSLLEDGFGYDVDSVMYYSNIHGVLAAVAFVGMFPLGAILLRAIPGRLAWLVHAVVQVLGYIIYVAGAALGIYLVRVIRIPPDGASLVSKQPAFQESTL